MLSAGAVSLAIWVIAVPVGGVDLAVRTGGGVQHVGPVATVVSSVIAAVLGFAALALLERRTPKARKIWTALAAGCLLVSLLGPFGATSGAAMSVLASMHAAVAAVVIITARRTTRRAEPEAVPR
ncbi:MAG: hypothetical protein GEV11_15840 [Streptosporangiales bacterium]|nr:hypothetical protein [Streptosporangiales bacterium]